MDIAFKDINELYQRVYPALKSKVKELKKNKIDYIKEVDIWNYLVESRWRNTKGLVLADIVDDILNTDNNKIEDYVKLQMKKMEREIDLDVEII